MSCIDQNLNQNKSIIVNTVLRIVMGVGFAVLLFIQQGCASIFAGKYQNVFIDSNIQNATIKVAKSEVVEVKSSTAKSNRMVDYNSLFNASSTPEKNINITETTIEASSKEMVTPGTIRLERDSDYMIYIVQNGKSYPCAYITHYFKNWGYVFFDGFTGIGFLIDLATGYWFSLPDEVVCINSNVKTTQTKQLP